jgi:hypothetical protein
MLLQQDVVLEQEPGVPDHFVVEGIPVDGKKGDDENQEE